MPVSAEGHGADDVGHAGPIAGHPASHAAPTEHPVQQPRAAPRAVERRTRRFCKTCIGAASAGPTKEWCQINPVKLADRPTVKKTETRIQFLDQAELEQLMAAPYPDDAFGRIEPRCT